MLTPKLTQAVCDLYKSSMDNLQHMIENLQRKLLIASSYRKQPVFATHKAGTKYQVGAKRLIINVPSIACSLDGQTAQPSI